MTCNYEKVSIDKEPSGRWDNEIGFANSSPGNGRG
jgi:hypothetical protein